MRLSRCLAAIAVASLMSAVVAGTSSAATSYALGVIGDIPYGSTQLSMLPKRIDQISADPEVRLVAHVGDISSPVNCSSSYYSTIKAHLERFADPLVYTPGDNEWADCHRASIGKGNPLTRLSTVRSTFFPVAGRTLGKAPLTVAAQAGYKENVVVSVDVLTVAAVHLVGSNNGLAPWSGLGYSSTTTVQRSEVTARNAAASAHLRTAFATARAAGSRAVVLLTQADMFVGSSSTYKSAYQSVVRTLAAESKSFGKPVFLINGDSHGYRADKPLASSKWLSFYGISGGVSNLYRYTVEGGSTMNEWLKFRVTDSGTVLSVQRVGFS